MDRAGSSANRSQFTRTDDAGRFTVRDLPTGLVPLGFHYGKLIAQGKYLALRDADPLTIKLRPVPDAAQHQARSDAAKAARANRKPLALGTPAKGWESGAWSDGRSRTLADYRGKIIFLNFWGIWCGPCVHELPLLEKLPAQVRTARRRFPHDSHSRRDGEVRPQGPGNEKVIARLRLRRPAEER